MMASGRGRKGGAQLLTKVPNNDSAGAEPIPQDSLSRQGTERQVEDGGGWLKAVWAGLPIGVSVLGCTYYGFAVADRYAIFLYGHTAKGITDAQPFDAVTRSRYWMAGLVVAGLVMVGYVAALWLAGRIAAARGRRFAAPVWWRVWLVCAPLLLLGIPLITMTVNRPTLPAGLALACMLATLSGLVLALLPGEWAAQRPLDLAWLAADGAALMPVLLLVKAVELPGRGVTLPVTTAWTAALGGMAASIIGLGALTVLCVWRRRPLTEWWAILAAGLALSYLLLPLVHYFVAGPPGYRYITTASNFFASTPALQALVLAIAAALAYGAARLRPVLSHHAGRPVPFR